MMLQLMRRTRAPRSVTLGGWVLQVHLLEQRDEPRVGPEIGEEERALYAVDAPRPLLVGTLQQVHCCVDLTQTRIDVRKVVGRNIPSRGYLLELLQYLTCLVELSGHGIRLAQLAHEEGVLRNQRDRLLQLGQALTGPAVLQIGPAEGGAGPYILGLEVDRPQRLLQRLLVSSSAEQG